MILIVGAGPTGLTLAIELARRGVEFRLVDRAGAFAHGSRGKGLQPRTLEVFHALGVVDRVLAGGSAYPRLCAHVGPLALGGLPMFSRRAASSAVPYPDTWMVPQAYTEAVLRARLAELGGRVELGRELVGLEQTERDVTAAFASGERVRARYLVGCDGGRSATRRLAGVAFEGSTRDDERMVVGDLEVEGLSRAHWHVWPFARGGPVALCPLPGGSPSLFQLVAALEPGRDAPPATAGGVQALLDAAGVRAAVRAVAWLSTWRHNARLAARYRAGRVLLAGDAAHVHPPAGGQGLNTGVQDAFNLGWKLAADRLLDTYEAERRPVAADVLGLSARLHDAKSMRRGPRTQQLGVSYRGGPLALELRAAPGRVRAGDRAPDGLVEGGRLFDLFAAGGFTVLAFGGARAEPRAGVRVVRADGARRAYDARGKALALVRPDGYVGAWADDARGLERALDAMA
jgi:2-polyprenyl-6-methoxyphenol hydroxylase-like FAD-dependent oxidoreductase